MITTVSRTFYEKNFAYLPLHSLNSIIQVKCASGQILPYLGYIEVDFSFPEEVNVSPKHKILALVVPDTEYNSRVPVVIGTNLIAVCYEVWKEVQQTVPQSRVSIPWDLAYSCLISRWCDPIPVHTRKGHRIAANSRTILSAKVTTPKFDK